MKNNASNSFMLMAIFFLFLNLANSQNPKKILTLGDSNGAFTYGWVYQLQKMLPNDLIFNTSTPGNTVGFDNLDQSKLNTLKNLDKYLSTAQDSLEHIDYILIMLGTNDAKYIFRHRQKEVYNNMQTLISKLKDFSYQSKSKPKIIIISPPPFGDNQVLDEKYKGGSKRIKHTVKFFKQIAKKNNCGFVNLYKELKHSFMNYSKDGIHLNEEGQKIIAKKVLQRTMNLN
ncbi:MAG: SGNH/GDSL hydrolase family protein [Flavobacteriaceae bacterium]|jgi:lysophospholipase L1-like esterase|nr:SGNH/GDSL hydrolase family protein [Flavobacteriaceae bacterium]